MKLSGILIILIMLTACGKSAPGSSTSPSSNPSGGGSTPVVQQQPAPTPNPPTCALDKPVPLANNPLEKAVAFSNVILDQDITDPELKHDLLIASLHPLVLKLFNIELNQKQTGRLGASINDGGSSYIGFADEYWGSFTMSSNFTKTGTQTLYNTEDSQSQNSKDSLSVITDGDKVISIQITYPIEEITDGQESYTGKFQTLCVKSMTPGNS